MLRAGAGFSTDQDLPRAAAEAAEAALSAAGADRADAALVFAGGGSSDLARAVAAAADRLGARALAGASAHGVLAAGHEEEERPAVAVLALVGAEAEGFLLTDLAGSEDAVGLEVESRLGRSATERDLVVAFADPLALDAERLARGLDESLAPAARLGAGSSLGDAGPSHQWCGRRVVTGAVAGLVVVLERPAYVAAIQGCRPITEPLRATRVDGHWVLELDGRPALDVYREVARAPLASDLRRAAEHLLVALPRAQHAHADGAYVVRGVVGFAPERRAFALGGALRAGDSLRLALRGSELAREDLGRALAEVAGKPPAAGLYLSCSGRGRGLFRHAGLETAYVTQALAPAPVAGMFGSFQLGPVAGAIELLTHAGVLALIS